MINELTAKDIIEALQPRSDDLSRIRHYFDALPILASHLPRPEQARLVIDANAAIGDVRWLASKRTNATARTGLQEAIASKTVVAFAPSYLDEEMRLKLAEISERESLPLEPLLTAWGQYRSCIRFYEAKRPTTSLGTSEIADPKDMPYIETYTAVGAAAILTDDPHLTRMGARTVRFELTMAMRDYARFTSIECTLKFHGVILTTIGIEVLSQFVRFIRFVFQLMAKAPILLQLLLGAALLFALLHRATRERLFQVFERGGEAVLSAAERLFPLLGELSVETRNAQVNARTAWDKVAPYVVNRPVPLRAHALAICMAASEPLTTDEIVQQLQRAGVKTTAKSFGSYLRRVLRSHDTLREVGPSRWAVVSERETLPMPT